ncbi:copper chaperone PCu(A)C [Parachitinimonas caeni]|uniref:Copper chaperone PCu(A)C n=1 Tax=Parachitinimonas caeni TaxID=3031301 RepID=A0ABT7DTC3_9NEIS|nr:copper chaperone PCu(A)C [Parachitinimonas caeni]MDK2123332.1 copper chaperone PCu(A)C [Parachitinimonas caeni]
MRLMVTLAFALLMGGLVQASDVKQGALEIQQPWARASIPGTTTGAIYLKLGNSADVPDALVGAKADGLADRIELHTHVHEKGVMKMRQVSKVVVPAKGSIALQPGAEHIMLFGLKRALKSGEKIPLTLQFEKAGMVAVEVKVEAIDANPADMQKKAH